jgi:16S rRNA processing protein RimM
VNPAKRELRIDPERAFASGAKTVEKVRVSSKTSSGIICAVETLNATPGGLIVTLGAGISRDAVASMKNATIEIERARRTRATRDEMSAEDWIGLDVVSVDGTRIGVIAGCIESPAHDILEIETPDGREVLLPAIEQIVESIDLDARCVVIGSVEGFGISDAD